MNPLRLLLPAIALASVAQEPTVRLGSPIGRIETEFSDLYGIAELPDGRAIVADRTDREFALVDFSTGIRARIGRNGMGPSEYMSAFGVVQWRADTLLGYDVTGRRLVKFSPGGALVGTVPGPVPGVNGGTAPPHGVDALGRLYWDTPRIDRTDMKRMTTSSILRWMPGTDDTELAGEIRDHADFEHRFRYRPWPRTDAWIVAPDGRIAVLSSEGYRLRWYRDGRLVDSGPPVPHDVVRAGAPEREAFREGKALEPTSGVSMGGGGSSRGLVGIERARAAWPDSLFPSVMPPFPANGMFLSPDGSLWVRRTRPARQAFEVVDVLDARGRLRATVRLPDRGRLFGVGSRGLYVVRVDDDGLQMLERYPWPELPR